LFYLGTLTAVFYAFSEKFTDSSHYHSRKGDYHDFRVYNNDHNSDDDKSGQSGVRGCFISYYNVLRQHCCEEIFQDNETD
jgi:hypothetical protein